MQLKLALSALNQVMTVEEFMRQSQRGRGVGVAGYVNDPLWRFVLKSRNLCLCASVLLGALLLGSRDARSEELREQVKGGHVVDLATLDLAALDGINPLLAAGFSTSGPTKAGEPHDLIALGDEELAQVSAGDFEIDLETFDVMIRDNEAGFFTLDIANTAFAGAQGLFTTLQTVNSAVDLNIIVNIFVNQQNLGT